MSSSPLSWVSEFEASFGEAGVIGSMDIAVLEAELGLRESLVVGLGSVLVGGWVASPAGMGWSSFSSSSSLSFVVLIAGAGSWAPK